MTNENLSSKQCPVCKQYDRTIPLDQLYFSLLSQGEEAPGWLQVSSEERKVLFRQTAPPALSRQPIWVVLSPDILAGIVFAGMLVFSIDQQIWERPNWFESAGVFLVLVLIYLLLRKRLKAWFRRKKEDRLEEIEEVKETVQYWENLFYCHRDRICFETDKKVFFPVNELQGKLQKV